MSNQLAPVLVRQHRIRLALSPEQYGERIRVSGMTVRRVEKGYTPFLSTQKKFADDLGIPHEQLFGVPELVVA